MLSVLRPKTEMNGVVILKVTHYFSSPLICLFLLHLQLCLIRYNNHLTVYVDPRGEIQLSEAAITKSRASQKK